MFDCKMQNKYGDYQAKCNICGNFFWNNIKEPRKCTNCSSTDHVQVPLWYGRSIPPEILGKELEDGRKIVPKHFVKVRAFLHPQEDDLSSWLAAEKWFKDQGWEWVEEEEFYYYNAGKRMQNRQIHFHVKGDPYSQQA